MLNANFFQELDNVVFGNRMAFLGLDYVNNTEEDTTTVSRKTKGEINNRHYSVHLPYLISYTHKLYVALKI